MKIDLFPILSIVSIFLTNGITWTICGKQRKNSTIQSLQNTIDVFEKKNRELYNEVINQRARNLELETRLDVFEH